MIRRMEFTKFIACVTIFCSLCISVTLSESEPDSVSVSLSDGLSPPKLGGTTKTSCNEACRKTYGLNDQERISDSGSQVDGCQRGCRFYSIVEILNKGTNHTGTLTSCFDNCKDAYLGHNEENEACRTGCARQHPYSRLRTVPLAGSRDATHGDNYSDEAIPHGLFPIMLMQSLLHSVKQHATWSIFTVQDKEGHTGNLVVVRTQPQVAVDFNQQRSRNFEEAPKFSFFKSARFSGDEINAAKATYNKAPDSSSNDWLTCLAQRTGVPRIFLCVLLLLSAVSMIWLCMSAAATAPNQRVKLSIQSGDLEYIRTLPQKKGICGVYPQAVVDARPLPTKIKMVKL